MHVLSLTFIDNRYGALQCKQIFRTPIVEHYKKNTHTYVDTETRMGRRMYE